ncbi:MAG: thermonuclease family protein [Candidatus Omnitrophica bacterium]|nr:thermonuclease family protein [Candidatus Omnitrophota bacterium]
MKITTTTYTKALKDIRARIAKGHARLEETFRRETLATNWDIGCIITERILPDSTDAPSAQNAKVVADLVSDLGRGRTFIYRLVKFYKCYPRRPKTSLTWSHYTYLSFVEDERTRDAFEQKAIKQGLSAKNLYRLIAKKKKKEKIATARLLLVGRQAKQVKNFQLPVTRGELYFYKCVRRDYIPCKKNERLVDIGFKVLRRVKTPAWKSPSYALYIRSYKKDGNYTLRIARPNDSKLYTYVATVQRVIDGDNIDLNIDLGFFSWVQENVRLRGIDASELSKARGQIAKKFVQDALKNVKFVVCKLYKEGSFGRMLADVFYLPKETDAKVAAQTGIFLNQQLLDEGLADVWKG